MRLFRFFQRKLRKPGLHGGGTGKTLEDAVIISAPSTPVGIMAEHAYVQRQCGPEDVDWKLERQALLEGPEGKHYDLLTVRLKDATVQEFYFDISSFFGKF